MSYLQHHGMIPCYLQLASKLSITWNGFQAKTTLASHPCYYYPDISMVILGCASACRESFRVFTFKSCNMTLPAGLYTYCQSKARYLSSIFRKMSPNKQMRNPVQGCIFQDVSWRHLSLDPNYHLH